MSRRTTPCPSPRAPHDPLGGLRRFLTAEQIYETTNTVAELAAREDVQVMLTGGAAMLVYGGDRYAADVDFVTSGPVRALAPTAPHRLGGYTTATPSGVPIDIIVRSGENDLVALWHEALDRAGKPDPRLGLPVVSREYLAAMMMSAEHLSRHVRDLEWLLLHSPPNAKKARAIAREHFALYGAKALDKLMDMAAFRRSRSK